LRRTARLGLTFCGLALTGFFGGCETVSETPLPPAAGEALCDNEVAEIYISHATAHLSDCTVISGDSLAFINRPENTPINDSAWYGFRVDPIKRGHLKISMKYEDGKHRYPPKISYDGTNWTVLPEAQISQDDEKTVELDLDVQSRPFFVSAQEILTKIAHDVWTDDIAEMPFATKSVIGVSRDGHPISMLTVQTEPSKKKPYVMWVGRQHPPEVTGALALMPFTETVLGDTPLATKFRDIFNVLIVPNMNPDGVTAGHWRHNKGGVDLKSALRRFETKEDNIVFFLDFHSTWRNLLYTQTDEEPTEPPMFARDWLAAVDAKLSDRVYKFTREPRKNSKRPISKNYMYDTYGISAITYEVGDNTDRDAIKTSAIVFAEEMMRLLLEYETKRRGWGKP